MASAVDDEGVEEWMKREERRFRRRLQREQRSTGRVCFPAALARVHYIPSMLTAISTTEGARGPENALDFNRKCQHLDSLRFPAWCHGGP